MGPRKSEDDLLLESRIQQNQLQYPNGMLYLIAGLVAFQPVFFSHTLQKMEWYALPHLGLFLVVGVLTAFMLHKAYAVMISSEFWRRQRHFAEAKGKEGEEQALRRVRLQRAMGYTLFFLNTGFFVLDTLFLTCFFHQMDPRAKFILSPLLSSALLWLISQKNEESRQRKLRYHK